MRKKNEIRCNFLGFKNRETGGFDPLPSAEELVRLKKNLKESIRKVFQEVAAG